MTTLLQGLHHVTATVNDAQEDVNFYTRVLGMRLVKKTVNFDNHHVYHFYYGNTVGQPGTIMTTFPYKDQGVPVGTRGLGQITLTSFSVPDAALDFWSRRLAAHGVLVTREASAFGEELLRFPDPSGLELRLVAASGDALDPWVQPEVGVDRATRGIHSVSLLVRDPARTLALLGGVLGGKVVDETDGGVRVAIGSGGPGRTVELLRAPAGAPTAVNGLGTVHHVAFAIGSPEEQLDIREELLRRGYGVTEVRDRQYFLSIYFREPNGVLFEIATVAPGFTVDEEIPCLGQDLKLPPWEEPYRADIEAHLPVLVRE